MTTTTRKAAAPRTLVSVDWDYFFPLPGHAAKWEDWQLYDWGHREATVFIDFIWPMRAAAFRAADRELPRTDGTDTMFWRWFCYFANQNNIRTKEVRESHVDAFAAARRMNRATDWPRRNGGARPIHVLHFDAHHDCGYTGKRVPAKMTPTTEAIDCGDWLGVLVTEYNATATIIYPPWRVECPESEGDADTSRLTYLYMGRDQDRIDALLRELAPTMDHLFICRSGAWTPPWLDKDFESFHNEAPGRRTHKRAPAKRKMDKDTVETLAQHYRKARLEHAQ